VIKSEADSEHYTYMITKMYSDSHYLLIRFMATDITIISLGYFYSVSIAAKSQHLSALMFFKKDIPCRGVDILCKIYDMPYISVAIRICQV